MASKPKASNEAKDDREFDRFERLTKKLLAVPKKEIDAEKAKAEGEARRGRQAP